MTHVERSRRIRRRNWQTLLFVAGLALLPIAMLFVFLATLTDEWFHSLMD